MTLCESRCWDAGTIRCNITHLPWRITQPSTLISSHLAATCDFNGEMATQAAERFGFEASYRYGANARRGSVQRRRQRHAAGQNRRCRYRPAATLNTLYHRKVARRVSRRSSPACFSRRRNPHAAHGLGQSPNLAAPVAGRRTDRRKADSVDSRYNRSPWPPSRRAS